MTAPKSSLMQFVRGAVGITKASLSMDAAKRETQEERYRICANCPSNDLGKCGACGCWIGPKVRLAGETCPQSHWLPEGNVEAIDVVSPGRVALPVWEDRISKCMACDRRRVEPGSPVGFCSIMSKQGCCNSTHEAQELSVIASFPQRRCPIEVWNNAEAPRADIPAAAIPARK